MLPTSPESTTATFDDDTAVLATDNYPTIDSQKLQTNLLVLLSTLLHAIVPDFIQFAECPNTDRKSN
jgi:hypothetical protein